VDPKAIQDEVDRLLGADQEAVRLATQFAEDVKRVDEIDKQCPNIDAELKYLERRLGEDDVKEDDFKASQLRERVRDLKELRAERRDVVRHANDLDASYNRRAGAYEQRVHARYEAERRQADSDAEVNRQAEQLSVAWMPAVQRAITTNKIPESLKTSFESFARRGALANLELGFTVDDVDSFLERQAKEFIETAQTFHREMAGQYGNDVRARTETPGPAPAAAVATAQVPQSDDLKDVYRLTRMRLEGRL
jgi:hypothetical protein